MLWWLLRLQGWHSTDKYRTTIWQCNNKFKKIEKCTTPHVREELLKEVFLMALNQLVTDKVPALAVMRRVRGKVDDTGELESRLQEVDRDFEATLTLFQDYIAKNTITEAGLNEGRYAELEGKFSDAKTKLEELRDELTNRRRRAA